MDVVPQEWAAMEFSQCELGDKRRTNRLVKSAALILARPDGSTPGQIESWSDCKALYRLMDCEEVSFEAITTPHYERTKQTGQPRETYLLLNDTTEINYGGKRKARGLGLGARNQGKGYFLHSALIRDPLTQRVIGLAGQEIMYRRKSGTSGAKNSRRRDEQRESVIWGKLIDQVGRPPAGVQWLHVCDRAADDDEVYCRAHRNGCGWVIRACRLNRRILTPAGKQTTLEDHLAEQPVCDIETLEVPAASKNGPRTALLHLRYARVQVPQPRITNAWIRQHAPAEPLVMSVVELVEFDPPEGVEPIRWVLLTSEAVSTPEAALRIVDYYRQRWAIEEYHKALKTGCRVEERYYETSDRLERITGLLAIVAVQLLKLRTLAEETPDAPAQDVVPREWVETLTRLRQRPGPHARQLAAQTMSIAEFVKHLGGLGGHLGRKCDGRPGWQTLWQGLEKLLLILRGLKVAQQKCG